MCLPHLPVVSFYAPPCRRTYVRAHHHCAIHQQERAIHNRANAMSGFHITRIMGSAFLLAALFLVGAPYSWSTNRCRLSLGKLLSVAGNMHIAFSFRVRLCQQLLQLLIDEWIFAGFLLYIFRRRFINLRFRL